MILTHIPASKLRVMKRPTRRLLSPRKLYLQHLEDQTQLDLEDFYWEDEDDDLEQDFYDELLWNEAPDHTWNY